MDQNHNLQLKQQQQNQSSAENAELEGGEFMEDLSSKGQELKQLQQVANASSQVQQLKALQMALNQKSAGQALSPDNGNGLPLQLKQGIEALSGLSMDDVKVHRNSSKPAEVGALAYANGNEIHLAAGQEQHLPHEAWHVVQQKQGRVLPTVKADNGSPVNDDPALEREADLMGAKAMQQQAAKSESLAEGQQSTSLQKKADPEEDVFQRIVTEVSPRVSDEMIDEGSVEKVDGIKSVNIVGRPKSPYSGTMGDHSTAFAVHREGLRIQLKNKSFEEGFQVLYNFYQGMKKLPGWEMVENLKGTQKDNFNDAKDRFETLLLTDTDTISATTISNFQCAVNELLEMRELLPMSTINVKAKSPSLAGKGKGEFTNVSTLVAHQEGTIVSNDFTLMAAVAGLFDVKSAGLALAELNDEMLEKMMPGLDPETEMQQRIDDLVLQHINSLKMVFPKVFEGSLTGEILVNHLKDSLKSEIGRAMVGQAKDYAWYEKKLEDQQWRVDHMLKDKAENIELEKRKAPVLANAKPKKKLYATYQSFFKRKLDINNPFVEALTKKEVPDKSSEETEQNEERQIKKRRLIEDDKSSSESSTPMVKAPELDSDEQAEEEERKSPLAMQIKLDKDGNISQIDLAGRTLSPHGNTMGAHSTAWVAHLDAVRNTILGKTPLDAIDEICNVLINELFNIEEDRLENFEVTKEHTKLYESAAKDLDVFRQEDNTPKDELLQLFHLQNLIRKYLTTLNYLPGSTIEKGDTGGKAEGTKRQTLLAFEKGEHKSVSELRAAMQGLLDIKGLDSEQKKELKEEHMKTLKIAYPKSYKAAYEVKTKKSSARSGKGGIKRKLDE